MTTCTSPRPHADTALPPIVSQQEWDAALAELLEVEKAHTRAMDAVAAKRRRRPMVDVDATLELVDAEGTRTLLDEGACEGRPAKPPDHAVVARG